MIPFSGTRRWKAPGRSGSSVARVRTASGLKGKGACEEVDCISSGLKHFGPDAPIDDAGYSLDALPIDAWGNRG